MQLVQITVQVDLGVYVEEKAEARVVERCERSPENAWRLRTHHEEGDLVHAEAGLVERSMGDLCGNPARMQAYPATVKPSK